MKPRLFSSSYVFIKLIVFNLCQSVNNVCGLKLSFFGRIYILILMITTSQLKNLGLSENESKVYLAMLELGPATVLEISAKAQMNRPTVYVQIESLKQKGLVSTQTKGKKQIFIAESPDQLSSLLDRESSEINYKKEELSKLLPDLNSLYNSSGTRPQVRFFEGREGLLRMQETFLASGEKMVYAITPLDEVLKVFPSHRSDYSQRRIKQGIRSKLIYSSDQGPILKESDEAMLRESKFIAPSDMPFTGDLTVYGSSVAITALRGNISGVIIEHPEIANSFKNFFEFLWKFTSNSENK
ncbi:MAG TPA: hypothetical protein DCS06_02385 [Candidatus Yanofskybacteria bacterium]|nr:hypothetical protein [Candidatus Yanofskybacteria bacterium]HBT80942.1 hypothetical protein [Candidatus Yanofskybacteria bacterium]HBX58089.1 hypothetical protein [Candidatus Yanofskybacteria bacterium]